jgi:hypothetical protein
MLSVGLTQKSGNDYWLDPLSAEDYDRLAAQVQELLTDVGQPLPSVDVDATVSSDYDLLKSNDGRFFTTVFARPIGLKDAQGDILASARWVRFQWDRSDGKPNRIIYGNTPYVVDGVFEADASAADLVKYFPSILIRDLLNL